MKIRRHPVLSATVLAVAIAAFATPTVGASASVPPTEPPPGSEPVPVDAGLEVESFALAPAGSLDPDEAGNRPEFSYSADPGSVIDDAVTLFNYGDRQLNFNIYATDAYNDDDGNFLLPAGDVVPVNVGSWVTFDQNVVTLPPGMQATIPIQITIPDDASPGDHVGAIVASSPTMGTGANGELITVDRRTGPRLYVRVNGDLSAEMAITDVDLGYSPAVNPMGGSAHVSFRVENRGNIRLGGTATVTVGGPFGLGEKKLTLPQLPELLPGEDMVVTADLSGIAAGFAAFTEVRLEPTSSGDGAGDPVVATGTDWTVAVPITPLLVVLLLVLGFWLRRRYRKHAAPAVTVPDQIDFDEQPEHVHS